MFSKWIEVEIFLTRISKFEGLKFSKQKISQTKILYYILLQKENETPKCTENPSMNLLSLFLCLFQIMDTLTLPAWKNHLSLEYNFKN